MKPSTALALREAPQVEPWREAEWQRLWLSVQAKPWKALAVCPAGAGVSHDFAVTVAVTLARTGMMHLGAPIQVADATRVQLSNAVSFANEVKRYREQGDMILIALAPVSDNPITASIAQAADATLLCVIMGKMLSADAKDTLAKIGRERFLGTAVFRPDLDAPNP